MLNIFGKKFDTNNLEIFLLFGLLHAAMLVIIDHTNIIPANIFPFPLYLIEQIFTVLMVFFLLSYDGYKSISLLLTSTALAVITCIPSISYLIIEFKLHSLSHNSYNIALLAITIFMGLFINYSYHKYNSLSLMYYQIYDAIYTSIAKVILAMVYLLFILICGIMIKAMFILLGYTFAQNVFESVIFRKCYISIAAAGAMWLTYNKEYVVDHLFVVISTACYYAYWVIAPLGLIFILSYLYSSFLFLELTHINYGILLAICFISMLCNMRMHATESHWKKRPKALKIIMNIYNKVLPILSTLLIYNIFFQFSLDTEFLDCQSHIMDTGIHWSNVSILVLTIFVLINNTAAAFFTSKKAPEKNNHLPLFAWYSLYAIIALCYAIFVFHSNNLEHSVDHVAQCEHFKNHFQDITSITNIRYIA
jgi:hypothetical protein